MAAHQREISVAIYVYAFDEFFRVFVDAGFFAKFAKGAFSLRLEIHLAAFGEADVAFLTADDYKEPKFVVWIKVVVNHSASFLTFHKPTLCRRGLTPTFKIFICSVIKDERNFDGDCGPFGFCVLHETEGKVC